MDLAIMCKKKEIAIGIALQTQVLQACPLHGHLYCKEEDSDDENMARAFALAVELVQQHEPYAEEFDHDPHQLTDLLTDVIGVAPANCPACQPQAAADLSGRSSAVCAFR
jgi:hypothetical protein